jgi:dTDP-4-dehydrorhamnose 3,5-epimerase
MPFNIEQTYFGGEVKVISSKPVLEDERGFFSVEYRSDEFWRLDLPTTFVQDNRSSSIQGTIRGLHFQPQMGKLMKVTKGIAWFVTVDLRQSSPTFLKWQSTLVSADNHLQVWAPWYFARGFAALTDIEVEYKCTQTFDATKDYGIRWNDPFINVQWPVEHPIVSERDKKSPLVVKFREQLPQ